MALTGYNSGAMTSITALSTNQMPDNDRMLYLLKPYQTPIFQWLYFSEDKAEVVINENGLFNWFEDEFVAHQVTLDGSGITGGAATEAIGIVSAAWINVGDIFIDEANDELVYVTVVTSATAITIGTLDGGNLSASAAAGGLKKLGSRNNEFATARTAISTKEILVNNYLNIHSETVTTSGRYQAGEKYTNGKTHDDQVQKKVEEMKYEFERMTIHSPSSGTATDASKYRFTWGKGFNGLITTNRTNYTAGSLTQANLDAFFKTNFAKGSGSKRMYCGSNLIQEISNLVRDRGSEVAMRYDNMVTEFGARVRFLMTEFGDVTLAWDPVMDGKYVAWGYLLDEEAVKMRFMAADDTGDRKFRIEDNVQAPGTDGKSTKIMMDTGVQLTNEETCSVLKVA